MPLSSTARTAETQARQCHCALDCVEPPEHIYLLLQVTLSSPFFIPNHSQRRTTSQPTNYQPFTISNHQSTHQPQTKMGPSITSQLLTLSRAALCPMSIKGAIIRFLLAILSWAIFLHLAYHADPDNMLPPEVTTKLDRGELFFTATLLSVETALIFLKWNFILLSHLYIWAMLDAALLCILKLSGRKSDIPPRWVTQWVTPSAAGFRALLVYLYPGLTEMMDEVRRGVEGPVYMGEHEGHCSMRG